MYKVYSSIELPKARAVMPDRARKYPFPEMEVGDMFFVPDANRKTLASHANASGRKLGMKFSVRTVFMHAVDTDWVPAEAGDEHAVTGVGIWRVK
jgi:hypothetical protein